VPPQQARVFMLREFMEFETDEICEQVGISSANVFVILHRARQRLRECVDQRWLSAPPTKGPQAKGGRA
jgi:RNA polymerase sigma-70 factor (ECF subfamily)